MDVLEISLRYLQELEVRRRTNFQYLIFTLDQQVQQFLGVDNRFSIVCHQANQSCVPFVYNLSKGSGARCHEDLTYSVVESLLRLIIHLKEALGSSLLGDLV